MTEERLGRLKRMAVNSGGCEEPVDLNHERGPFVDKGELGIFFDYESLARFARAVAEDCAKVADDSPDYYTADRIRNLYKDQ